MSNEIKMRATGGRPAPGSAPAPPRGTDKPFSGPPGSVSTSLAAAAAAAACAPAAAGGLSTKRLMLIIAPLALFALAGWAFALRGMFALPGVAAPPVYSAAADASIVIPATATATATVTAPPALLETTADLIPTPAVAKAPRSITRRAAPDDDALGSSSNNTPVVSDTAVVAEPTANASASIAAKPAKPAKEVASRVFLRQRMDLRRVPRNVAPIHISRDHHWAFYSWLYNLRAGRLHPEGGYTVVHVDTHSDLFTVQAHASVLRESGVTRLAPPTVPNASAPANTPNSNPDAVTARPVSAFAVPSYLASAPAPVDPALAAHLAATVGVINSAMNITEEQRKAISAAGGAAMPTRARKATVNGLEKARTNVEREPGTDGIAIAEDFTPYPIKDALTESGVRAAPPKALPVDRLTPDMILRMTRALTIANYIPAATFIGADLDPMAFGSQSFIPPTATKSDKSNGDKDDLTNPRYDPTRPSSNDAPWADSSSPELYPDTARSSVPSPKQFISHVIWIRPDVDTSFNFPRGRGDFNVTFGFYHLLARTTPGVTANSTASTPLEMFPGQPFIPAAAIEGRFGGADAPVAAKFTRPGMPPVNMTLPEAFRMTMADTDISSALQSLASTVGGEGLFEEPEWDVATSVNEFVSKAALRYDGVMCSSVEHSTDGPFCNGYQEWDKTALQNADFARKFAAGDATLSVRRARAMPLSGAGLDAWDAMSDGERDVNRMENFTAPGAATREAAVKAAAHAAGKPEPARKADWPHPDYVPESKLDLAFWPHRTIRLTVLTPAEFVAQAKSLGFDTEADSALHKAELANLPKGVGQADVKNLHKHKKPVLLDVDMDFFASASEWRNVAKEKRSLSMKETAVAADIINMCCGKPNPIVPAGVSSGCCATTPYRQLFLRAATATLVESVMGASNETDSVIDALVPYDKDVDRYRAALNAQLPFGDGFQLPEKCPEIDTLLIALHKYVNVTHNHALALTLLDLVAPEDGDLWGCEPPRPRVQSTDTPYADESIRNMMEEYDDMVAEAANPKLSYKELKARRSKDAAFDAEVEAEAEAELAAERRRKNNRSAQSKASNNDSGSASSASSSEKSDDKSLDDMDAEDREAYHDAMDDNIDDGDEDQGDDSDVDGESEYDEDQYDEMLRVRDEYGDEIDAHARARSASSSASSSSSASASGSASVSVSYDDDGEVIESREALDAKVSADIASVFIQIDAQITLSNSSSSNGTNAVNASANGNSTANNNLNSTATAAAVVADQKRGVARAKLSAAERVTAVKKRSLMTKMARDNRVAQRKHARAQRNRRQSRRHGHNSTKANSTAAASNSTDNGNATAVAAPVAPKLSPVGPKHANANPHAHTSAAKPHAAHSEPAAAGAKKAPSAAALLSTASSNSGVDKTVFAGVTDNMSLTRSGALSKLLSAIERSATATLLAHETAKAVMQEKRSNNRLMRRGGRELFAAEAAGGKLAAAAKSVKKADGIVSDSTYFDGLDQRAMAEDVAAAAHASAALQRVRRFRHQGGASFAGSKTRMAASIRAREGKMRRLTVDESLRSAENIEAAILDKLSNENKMESRLAPERHYFQVRR